MWMCQDFPLTLEHVTPMLEVLSMQVRYCEYNRVLSMTQKLQSTCRAEGFADAIASSLPRADVRHNTRHRMVAERCSSACVRRFSACLSGTWVRLLQFLRN